MLRRRRPDSKALRRYFEVTPQRLSRFPWEQINTTEWNGKISPIIPFSFPSAARGRASIWRLTNSLAESFVTFVTNFHSGIITTSVFSLPILLGAKDVLLNTTL